MAKADRAETGDGAGRQRVAKLVLAGRGLVGLWRVRNRGRRNAGIGCGRNDAQPVDAQTRQAHEQCGDDGQFEFADRHGSQGSFGQRRRLGGDGAVFRRGKGGPGLTGGAHERRRHRRGRLLGQQDRQRRRRQAHAAALEATPQQVMAALHTSLERAQRPAQALGRLTVAKALQVADDQRFPAGRGQAL